MPQIISEYRAMRACVLRQWGPRITQIDEDTTRDMVRFNEAIDQALAESAVMFAKHAARTRDTFLAILGHDLRSPLATISMAGEYLTRPGVTAGGTTQVGAKVRRSAATMTAMVNDLLEYARQQLGRQMPITLQLSDLEQICHAAIDDAKATHPGCKFEMSTSGELIDDFDSARLQQVVSNLLNNAAQYRGKDNLVAISAEGDRDAITIKVRNRGPVIAGEAREAIFEPLVQLPSDETSLQRPPNSLGLGLYIARQITEAHGGTISVESSESSGTIFTVKLPRAMIDTPVS